MHGLHRMICTGYPAGRQVLEVGKELAKRSWLASRQTARKDMRRSMEELAATLAGEFWMEGNSRGMHGGWGHAWMEGNSMGACMELVSSGWRGTAGACMHAWQDD